MYSTGCMLFRWDMAWGGGGGDCSCVGCFGAQCSVAPARGQRFKERVGVRGPGSLS